MILLAEHTTSHAIQGWGPLIIAFAGVAYAALRTYWTVQAHGRRLDEMHICMESAKDGVHRVEGKVDALIGFIGDRRPGGRRWYDDQGRLHDEGGG